MGNSTELRDGSNKLFDESNQLQFHFEKETTSICNRTFNKLKNVQGAYLQIKWLSNNTGIHLYNIESEK